MQARSALFDLYGDYLRPRGSRAPVPALVKLLARWGSRRTPQRPGCRDQTILMSNLTRE